MPRLSHWTAMVGLPVLLGTSLARADTLSATLTGYDEVPAIFSQGKGTFTGTTTVNSITYTLNYEGLENVSQAHIHFAQPGVNGGISAFLCTNLGNGPAGTPACPPSGPVSGSIIGARIIGPAAQNVGAGQINRLLQAIKKGRAYVNVHTTGFPSGEIRGQLSAVR